MPRRDRDCRFELGAPSSVASGVTNDLCVMRCRVGLILGVLAAVLPGAQPRPAMVCDTRWIDDYELAIDNPRIWGSHSDRLDAI